jgi:hypothetical protein
MVSNTAWGFAGNTARESRADPHSQPGDMGAAHGAFMWRASPDAGRRLTDYINKWRHVPEQGSLDEQLNNMMFELTGKESHAWNNIQGAGGSGAAGANGHVQVDVHLHNAPPGTTASVVAWGTVTVPPPRVETSMPSAR